MAAQEAAALSQQHVKICCPKCQSRNLNILEVWETTIEWQVKNGILNRAAGVHHNGSPIGVQANCLQCKHHWTARKATQIFDVFLD